MEKARWAFNKGDFDFDNLNASFKQEHSPFKMSIKGVRTRNPVLNLALQQSILNNLSNILNIRIHEGKREILHSLFKRGKTKRVAEERFLAELRKVIVDLVNGELRKKLLGKDIPTSVFPTSDAYDEAPNYYIPSESYTQGTKIILINHLANLVVGRCGNMFYGLYIPEEPEEAQIFKECFKEYTPSFYQINIASLTRMKLDLQSVGPFEYLFYLLDGPLKEMYRKEVIPSFHIELFTSEKRLGGRGKILFSHHVIPSLEETYFKLYQGQEKYTRTGSSKIKTLITSFLPERWGIGPQIKEKIIKEAHMHINNFMHRLFVHKVFDLDSFLLLEELKLKSGDTTRIWFADEVISWM